jgi:hypothetical protein
MRVYRVYEGLFFELEKGEISTFSSANYQLYKPYKPSST